MSFAPDSSLNLEGLNKFLSITYHHWIHYAVYAFADLRIADILINAPAEEGYTVEQILGQERKQWNGSLLGRILNTNVIGGIVKHGKDDQHYVLTETGKLLTSEHPAHARDYLVFLLGPVAVGGYQQLPIMINTGSKESGVALSQGCDFYAYISKPENKELLGVFSNMMTTTAAVSSQNIVDAMDFSRFKTMVDVGGNRGTLLAYILNKFPNIEQGILFDLPPVVNKYEGGEEFDIYKVPKNRWKFVAGSMYDASTIPQADAYIIKYVIHSVSDEEVVKTFRSIRDANANKKTPTTLYVVEHIILPDDPLGAWQTYAYDMLMAAVCVGARERSVPEYTEFLKQGGFELKKVHVIQAPQSVIEAQLITN